MTPIPFDWNSIQPGEKLAASLAIPGTEIVLPVLAARGIKPGKTLVVSAGVHGDEPEGIQTIFDIFRALDPQHMSGSVIAVTVANPPAFWNNSRTSPLDGANLARVFPGNPNGSPTEAIAYQFDQRILPLADLYIDLHSAGVKWQMPTLIGYCEQEPAAALAAEVFGAEVIWQHPAIAPGRTVSAAHARGIPSLYCEARGSGRIHADDLDVYYNGLRRLLQHLHILEGAHTPTPKPIRLRGDGNIDKGIEAKQPGFLTPMVDILQHVEQGQPLGILQDLWGRTLEEFFAPCSGVVVLIHALPMVQPGEPLFLITDRIGE